LTVVRRDVEVVRGVGRELEPARFGALEALVDGAAVATERLFG
jgi:hypothetical protein